VPRNGGFGSISTDRGLRRRVGFTFDCSRIDAPQQRKRRPYRDDSTCQRQRRLFSKAAMAPVLDAAVIKAILGSEPFPCAPDRGKLFTKQHPRTTYAAAGFYPGGWQRGRSWRDAQQRLAMPGGVSFWTSSNIVVEEAAETVAPCAKRADVDQKTGVECDVGLTIRRTAYSSR
jgi:hypothetical protein